MSDRIWNAHVVAILKRHPREAELSLEELDELAEPVFEALIQAHDHIESGLAEWPFQGEEGRKLYAEVWVEAARMHR